VNHWPSFVVWATWIAGGRQVTTLSYYYDFEHVVRAVQQHIDEVGAVGVNPQPLMLISEHAFKGDQAEALRDLPEGSITLIIE
jgi:hypothetical protein